MSIPAVFLSLLLGGFAPGLGFLHYTPGNPARRKIASYSDHALDVVHALNNASDRLHIPIGIELAGPLDSGPVSVHLANCSAADVFSAIMQHAPRYDWTEQGGVVNVGPRNNTMSVADVRVARFDVTNATPDDLREAIMSLPEVQAWLAKNRVVGRSFGFSSLLGSGKQRHSRISLRLRSVTVRELLNRIVTKPGFHIWALVRYREARAHYLSIEIQ